MLTILPRRNQILHDLITRVFMRSLQYGIVVPGFFVAFVFAHHTRRLDSASAENCGDCMKGRVRLMTDITPAYAHAYQATCLAQHFLGVPHHICSDFPSSSPDIHTFPMIVPSHVKQAMIITRGLFHTKVLLSCHEWCNYSWMRCDTPIFHVRIDVMCGPVDTTES